MGFLLAKRRSTPEASHQRLPTASFCAAPAQRSAAPHVPPRLRPVCSLDFVKGFHGSHVKDYLEASKPEFVVGELPSASVAPARRLPLACGETGVAATEKRHRVELLTGRRNVIARVSSAGFARTSAPAVVDGDQAAATESMTNAAHLPTRAACPPPLPLPLQASTGIPSPTRWTAPQPTTRTRTASASSTGLRPPAAWPPPLVRKQSAFTSSHLVPACLGHPCSARTAHAQAAPWLPSVLSPSQRGAR